jgi:hypothetical protein
MIWFYISANNYQDNFRIGIAESNRAAKLSDLSSEGLPPVSGNYADRGVTVTTVTQNATEVVQTVVQIVIYTEAPAPGLIPVEDDESGGMRGLQVSMGLLIMLMLNV